MKKFIIGLLLCVGVSFSYAQDINANTQVLGPLYSYNEFLPGVASYNSTGMTVNGYLGVGTTSPAYNVDIVGQVKTRLASGDGTGIFLGYVGTNQPQLQFDASDSSARFKMQINGINTTLERLGIYAGPVNTTATTELISILGSGYVGIANTAPIYPLDVTGIIRSTGLLGSYAALSGNVTSGGKFLAAEGTATAGGYSFTVDGSQDTGMFSSGDGILSLYENGSMALQFNSSNYPIFSALTGYVYCNGSTACSSATTIPASSISGIPASVTVLGTDSSKNFIDNSTVTLSNSTTGNAGTATETIASIPSTTTSGSVTLVQGNILAGTDKVRIAAGLTASDAGYLELATADNGTEPIYVRQYTGTNDFTAIANTLTLLDESGDTTIPGELNGSSISMSGGITTNGALTVGDTAATNSGIELGNVSGTSSTPYMDWHSTGGTEDYDARIIASGGTSGTAGLGTLTIDAASVSLPAITDSALTSTTVVGTSSTGLLQATSTIGSGNVVLATELDSYLPLTGGTLTGTLYGANSDFTGTSTVSILVDLGGATISGLLNATGSLNVAGSSALGTVTGGTWNGNAITNAYLANSSTTVNGVTCTLGSTCTISTNSTTAFHPLSFADMGATVYTASQVITYYVAPIAETILTSGTVNSVTCTSKAMLQVAATSSMTININDNGSSIGTITFAASGTSGTVSLTSTTLSAGDIITFVAPSTADTTGYGLYASVCAEY